MIPVMSFAFLAGDGGSRLDADLDIAPKGGGLTGGLFNFCANLAGSSPRW